MLKFFLTFITKLIARFIWIGIGFAVIAIFGRGQRAKQVKLSLSMIRRLAKF